MQRSKHGDPRGSKARLAGGWVPTACPLSTTHHPEHGGLDTQKAAPAVKMYVPGEPQSLLPSFIHTVSIYWACPVCTEASWH